MTGELVEASAHRELRRRCRNEDDAHVAPRLERRPELTQEDALAHTASAQDHGAAALGEVFGDPLHALAGDLHPGMVALPVVGIALRQHEASIAPRRQAEARTLAPDVPASPSRG